MEFKELSIKEESQRFKEHILQNENERIILSGIFGIGKTYFIDKFFQENSKDFIEIKLNPVNYSVSQNEDIFELIKFDICFQLFSKNPKFEKEEFGTLFSSEFYLLENYKSVISLLAKNLSKLDHTLNAIVSSTLELGKKIEDFKKEVNIDEEKELKDFLKFFSLKSGTYREENSITELLNGLVKTLKDNNPEKKIVLVIDDLDRIDPEHIFRIMNVFSAHFDYYDFKGENKFGFDKVLLICDIENIRGIFHNKYGTNIDFAGYIDKFYSLEVFNYNFSSVIVKSINKFLDNIKFKDDSNSIYLSSDNYYGVELTFILTHLISSNGLSMRSLVNFLKKDLVISNYSVKYDPLTSNSIHSKSTPVFIILEILEKILGGKKNFIKAIDLTINQKPFIEISPYNDYLHSRIGNLIMLVDYQHSNLIISKEYYIYNNIELDIKVQFKIETSGGYYGVYGKSERIGFANEEFTIDNVEFNQRISKLKVPYFQLLKLAYETFTQLPKSF